MISRKLLSRWRSLREREKRLVEPASGWSFGVLLVFPNFYQVGVSNLGFQTIYRILNEEPGFVCDLLYFPEDDIQVELERGAELASFYLEKTPMEFDVILFSVSFENDLLNVIKLLRYMRIPVLSSDRDGSYPLIVGGGMAPTANPEPFAPVFDLIYLGEAEVGLVDLLRLWADASDRENFLDAVKDLEWVYVPSRVEVDETGPFWSPEAVEKFRAYDSEFQLTGNVSVIISDKSSFPDSWILEVSRGCPRRCKFCLSSHLIRPVRFVRTERISDLVSRGVSKKIGLLGTAVSDHKGLAEVIENNPDTIFTFSSVRPDAHKSFFEALKRSGAKSVALGVEAATERLRSYIGKPIPDDLILERARDLSGHFQILKLYFMVGLPGETEEDLWAFGKFVEKVRRAFDGRISISVAPFVPKPFTPFEREAFVGVSEAKSRIRVMKRVISGMKNVNITHDLPRWAKMQTLISRGDRRVGLYLAGKMRKIDEDLFLSSLPCNVGLPWSFIKLPFH